MVGTSGIAQGSETDSWVEGDGEFATFVVMACSVF